MINLSKFIFSLILLLVSSATYAQSKKNGDLDSLLGKFSVAAEDTNKVNLSLKIAVFYQKAGDYQLAIDNDKKGLAIAAKLHWPKGTMKLLAGIGSVHEDALKYDTAISYYKQAMLIAAQQHDVSSQTTLYRIIGRCYMNLSDSKHALDYLLKGVRLYNGKDTSNQHIVLLSLSGSAYQHAADYKTAFAYYLRAKRLSDQGSNNFSKAVCNFYLGAIYRDLREYSDAIKYSQLALKYYQQGHRKVQVLTLLVNIGVIYGLMSDYDNAMLYEKKALVLAVQSNDSSRRAVILNDLSDCYFKKKNYSAAYRLNLESISVGKQVNNRLMYSFNTMGEYLNKFPDSVLIKFGVNVHTKYKDAIGYFNRSNKLAQEYQDFDAMKFNYDGLSYAYEQLKDYKQAYNAYRQFVAYRDSDYSDAKKKDFTSQQLQYEYGRREDSLKYQQTITGTKLRAKQTQQYYFIAGFALLVALIFFVGRNYLNQKRSNRVITDANHQLSEQQEEIIAQRDHLTEALGDLKDAQHQLIQSAKMASLGELTAGIAHEIQNPLNFVNNFSEVSVELTGELSEELDNGGIDEAKAIVADIRQNLEKVCHHGKRADNIVKGMLQHSRASGGLKEPTNLNTLADEYLRLAYHGLRAKEKDFNLELITQFDESLPRVNMIPQDIGRVLLNLFNNAFYAVQQQAKTAGPGYEPTVKVESKQGDSHVIITVTDNGPGIPDAIKDKIMQPFFTTKPTGEGTGLGLSLSYDIITKGHNGKITVESAEGQYSKFVVILPV